MNTLAGPAPPPVQSYRSTPCASYTVHPIPFLAHLCVMFLPFSFHTADSSNSSCDPRSLFFFFVDRVPPAPERERGGQDEHSRRAHPVVVLFAYGCENEARAHYIRRQVCICSCETTGASIYITCLVRLSECFFFVCVRWVRRTYIYGRGPIPQPLSSRQPHQPADVLVVRVLLRQRHHIYIYIVGERLLARVKSILVPSRETCDFQPRICMSRPYDYTSQRRMRYYRQQPGNKDIAMHTYSELVYKLLAGHRSRVLLRPPETSGSSMSQSKNIPRAFGLWWMPNLIYFHISSSVFSCYVPRVLPNGERKQFYNDCLFPTKMSAHLLRSLELNEDRKQPKLRDGATSTARWKTQLWNTHERERKNDCCNMATAYF